MSTATTHGTEPIPGYALLERIGAGAYGEVWRAEVPGGLVKAVKIVHGHYNESRALREMKALQRIKQLRHPFLLSLERFEIADGRLIIVTELADMSLKERFLACRAEGAPGIARSELLCHLHDAADALDYINESQSLQHLDVKAENLLLIGGRLKLADFGLVQNLSESDASFLDGMTPRYAAPEIFKGRPSKFSDQFSLAVVYTELLTGQAPFDAKSPAEFAVQHLIGAKPKLDLLSDDDQTVVTRALARKPEDRYPNCRAFVDALLARNLATASGGATAKSAAAGMPLETAAVEAAPAGAVSNSTTVEPAARRDCTPVGDEITVVLGADCGVQQLRRGTENAASARRLPPLEFEPPAWQPRPTLFVGIGGAATQALGRLRQRLEERFLFPDRIPAWRMLLIDTDEAALENSNANSDSASSPACETLLLKLRTTQEYREGSPQLLKWLSRRWLYNISRVPRTSGWRPLGRLALVDHGREVMNRLRRVIGEFATADAQACSVETVNAEFAGKPEIVLVASISGGTGSGMVLDMAYAIRKLAAEMDLGDYTLRGVLLHATDNDAESRDLARANSFACLTEMAHYNRPGCGYPGEDSLEVPAFPSIVPTFDEAFVTHLGDGLVPSEFVDQIERVSDCLYYGLATRAGTLLNCPQVKDDSNWAGAKNELGVRTFGLYSVNNLRRDEVDAFVDRVCQTVAEKWIGSGINPIGISAGPRQGAATGSDGIVAQPRELVEGAFGPHADQNFLRELTKSLEDHIHKTSAAHAQSPDRSRPFQLNRTLSTVGTELTELAASLRGIRMGTSLSGPPDQRECESPGKLPLASIRSTVQSFLDKRIAEIAGDLATDFPRLFLRRERRPNDAEDQAGQTLSGFCRHLRMTARAGIMQALKQVDVSRLLLEMSGKSRAAREPMRELLAAAQPRLFVTDAAERLFVFAPGYSDRTLLKRFFNDDLHENATIVQTEDDRLALYFERGQISLAGAAASLVAENFRYAEMAARLHTRIDVQWSPLRSARQEEPLRD